MDIDRCYFCKFQFSQAPHLPGILTCLNCPLAVNHFEADSGLPEFDYITIQFVLNNKKYLVTFNPLHGNEMDILDLDHGKDNIHYADLIATLERPDNLSPSMLKDFVERVLKMKAFL